MQLLSNGGVLNRAACPAVAKASTFFHRVMMVGSLPAGYDVPWRSNALLQEATAGPGGADITGGWLTGNSTLHYTLGQGGHCFVVTDRCTQHAWRQTPRTPKAVPWPFNCPGQSVGSSQILSRRVLMTHSVVTETTEWQSSLPSQDRRDCTLLWPTPFCLRRSRYVSSRDARTLRPS